MKMSLNPFCEIAVQEAVNLKTNHKGKISEIVSLTIGPKEYCLKRQTV
jgi:electron transfer flavoprotein alpha/beta subunit